MIFHGPCSRVVFIFWALLELTLGTTKLCLTLLLLLSFATHFAAAPLANLTDVTVGPVAGCDL